MIAPTGYHAVIELTGDCHGVVVALGPKARKDIEIGENVSFYWGSYFDIDGKRHAVIPDINMAKV